MTPVLTNYRLLAPFALGLLACGGAVGADRPDDAAKVDYFEKKVRPVLVSHCSACHSAETKPAGGLRVDDRKGLLSGGNTGPAVVPGKPRDSLLLRRVTQKDAKRRMPLEGTHLSAEQVAVLTKWIEDGAVWPAVAVPASLGKARARYEKLKKEHWVWRPLTAPAVPRVEDSAWPRTDIDRFVLAKLEAAGLGPVGDADRETLLRRVTFDLAGLPPTPGEIDAFLKDDSPEAYARVVDRLLASRRFGERWGRHWLDVARYGESTGPSRNIPYPHAWRYRDYVIDAVNADVPFDRFVREQVAGDLLPAGSDAERDRLLTATGLLALGVKDVNQRFKERFDMDNVDEQIDVVTRGVLGLTASCARCHDHKFDPIPTTDYYALAGIFASTDNAAGLKSRMGGAGLAYYVPEMLLRLSTKSAEPPAGRVKELEGKVAKAKAAWDAIRGTAEGRAPGPNGQPKQRRFRLEYDRLRAELATLTDPAARGHAVHGARDARAIADTEVRIRGEAEKRGPVVPRGFLTAFEVPGAAGVNREQSGRLELAEWLASPKNPLTPRVIVNRVWGRLFGEGIVTTVDNFGVNGDTPSHPELLDHLAGRFLADGWSIKRLVRSVVLSRAYRLGAESTEKHRIADPGNRLVWRHTPRRLDAEEVRDAILASAGTLVLGRPEASPAAKLRMVEIRDNGPEAAAIHVAADRSTHRSVYLPWLRGLTPRTLEVFDPVEQTLVTGRRDATTVPGQALYLLNSAFVRRQSLALAEKLIGNEADSDTARIGEAYRLALGRLPTAREAGRAKAFLAEYEAEYRRTDVPGPARPARVAKPKPAKPQPENPDDVDQTGEPVVEEEVRPRDARSASWLALAQALYGSAEFRYVK
jgi:hypothetical protein